MFYGRPSIPFDLNKTSLQAIGPAVMNGGITTFLGVVMLCDSQSYVFQVFFKGFFLTVVFGLFHSIVFLPILLGMDFPHFKKCKQQQVQQDTEQEKGCNQESIECEEK